MSGGQLTPLFRQYHQVKREHRGMLLLFRMGDFYELFYEDAERASALLGLTLTKRANQGQSVPMAGVPAHSVQQYLSRLVRLGESVAVCDQVGDQAGGGLMERRVTQVVTPGTLVDAGMLAEREACLAMAIIDGPIGSGYAWLELASMTLRAGECAPSELAGHIARLAPSELVVPEASILPAGLKVAVKHLPDWEFEPDRARMWLAERLGAAGLEGFGLADKPLAAACAAALLGYAENTQRRELAQLIAIGAEQAGVLLHLPPEARRSLELTASIAGEGPTLLATIDKCASAPGSRELRKRLHNPLVDHERLLRRQDAWKQLAEAGLHEPVRAWLAQCCDLQRIAARIGLGNVRPRELAALRSTLDSLPQLRQLLAGLAEPSASRYAAFQADCSHMLEPLALTLAAEPAASLRDGGVIASSASAELARLRESGGDLARMVAQLQEQERESTGLAGLRIGRNRVHGMYIELPRSLAGRAPAHYRRLQTLKHAERYVTDELAAAASEAETASERALELEEQLYGELVGQLRRDANALHRLAEAAVDLDVAGCMAQLAAERGWQCPAFAAESGISIRGGRHPVVEETVEYFEPNNAELGPQQRMKVLTGPNMGGKSTYMRQVALIALLAHIGAPVPAEHAVIGGLRAIHTRIGAADDLARGRSTFMVEMAETAAILNTAGAGSLVVLDEIGRGTSTYDGLSLAWAAAETLLAANGPLVLLATHYFELAELADQHPHAANYHMAVGEHGGEAVMLHRLEPGAASRSFGLQVAKMAGIPRHTLDLARKRLALLLEAASGNAQPGDLFGAGRPAGEDQPGPGEQVAVRLLAEDLDALSPREAQQLLYELRSLAGGSE